MTPTFDNLRWQRGFTIVEILVAALIGLLGSIVIFQAYSVTESQKRATSADSDMDISGRLALYALRRDLRLAGYGFGQAAAPAATGAGAAMGCTVSAYSASRPAGARSFSFPLVPARIAPGAAGAPDTIDVLYGNSRAMAAAKVIDQVGADTIRVKTNTGGRTGVERGDVIALVSTGAGLACGLYEVTGDANADQLTFDAAAGDYQHASGATVTARFNDPGNLPFALAGEGRLYALGPVPMLARWQVEDAKLVMRNELAYSDADGDGVNDRREIADDIVNLKAQYGYDADGDGVVADAEWTTAAPADWTRVLGIRFAVLARGRYERDPVTTVAPQWEGGAFVMTNVDGTPDDDPAGPNNWRNYRYAVYQGMVPLKNTIWGTLL